MRSLFIVILSTLFGATLFSPLAHAQAIPADPSLPSEATPEPLADAPVAAPPADASDDDDDDDDGDDESNPSEDSGPGSLWAPTFVGGGACVGLDVIGGALATLGCIFSQVTPAGSGDNCAEDCLISIISAGMVVLGVLIATAGLIVLGPLAALVVTAGATISSAIAGRAFWGTGLGGLPGIALGVGGLVVAGFGFAGMDLDGSGSLEPGIFSGEPSSNLALLGVGMAASAGVVALVGALSGDALFTSFMDAGEEPKEPRTTSRPPSRDELPLAFAPALSSSVRY